MTLICAHTHVQLRYLIFVLYDCRFGAFCYRAIFFYLILIQLPSKWMNLLFIHLSQLHFLTVSAIFIWLFYSFAVTATIHSFSWSSSMQLKGSFCQVCHSPEFIFLVINFQWTFTTWKPLFIHLFGLKFVVIAIASATPLFMGVCIFHSWMHWQSTEKNAHKNDDWKNHFWTSMNAVVNYFHRPEKEREREQKHI